MGMNILVCTKFVPDPNQLQVDPATGRPDMRRTPFRINTFDENAIEAGLRLAAEHGGRVCAVSIAPSTPPRELLLKALAMGVDAIYLVLDEERVVTEPLRIATVLAAASRAMAAAEDVDGWDMVLCGEQSVDEINGQVGARLACLLDLPCVTHVTRISVDGECATLDRAMEDHGETVEAPLPVLATVGMEINDPRMPTVLQIMGAGRKPIKEVSLTELDGIDPQALAQSPAMETLDVFSPPNVRKNIRIEGETVAETVSGLVKRLGADGEIGVR